MSFVLEGFNKIGASTLGFAPSLYTYGLVEGTASENDTLANISVAGYFNAVADRLKVGYSIILKPFDTVSVWMTVTAVSPDLTLAEMGDAAANDVTSVNGLNGVVVLSPENLQVAETGTTSLTLAETTTYFGSTGGVAKTVNLSSAAALKDGFQVMIKDQGGDASGAQPLTIGTEGSETIDTQASIDIIANYGVLRVRAQGGQWFTY